MIRRRKARDGLQVQVYAGRDPLTGRKRYVSRQVHGTGRAAMKHAEQVEAQLLAEVGAGRHPRSAITLAQLLDEWLTWRERNSKPISPATLHGYRSPSRPRSSRPSATYPSPRWTPACWTASMRRCARPATLGPVAGS